MTGNHYKGHEVSCCIKYFIFGFNILFWLLGMALVGIGLWAWSEKASAWWLGLCPRDPAGLSPEMADVGHTPSSRLTTPRKVHEGPDAMWFGK
ncbi:hypothetical protein L3Q82_004129 [Scortum barcoo]|uniref:Uncharacterized protein n=1 Tax=Scortum barcoo TaxID=214431 RepID=A0ACB8X737_9TELE|nr:hypothetical protein L3Q82_004129 [Scortum barcoo]